MPVNATAKPAPSRHRRTTGAAADRITEQLSRTLGPRKYEMWFGNTHMNVDDDRLEVATDSAFVARWIDTHFASELRSAATETLGGSAAITVSVKPELFDSDADDIALHGRDDDPDAPSPDRAPERRAARSGRGEASRATPANPRPVFHRLDEYIVGRSNRLAYSAAMQLAEDPQPELVSPLFLHGECGVGKTHLLQGIAQRYRTMTGRAGAMRYVTGEQFTNEYIAAVRTNRLEEFRRRTRKLDLLAIDDVHFLSNKVKTQNEFLHTLDAIGLTGARIVLASDDHPRHIKRFSQALVSRFLSGMVVQIDRPDRDTRLELIKRLAAARGLDLSPAAVDRISSRCVGSVRELQGAILKLAAMQSIAGQPGPVGLALVEQLFQERTWQPSTPIRIEQVMTSVCERLGIAKTDLIGRGRHRRVVLGRALVAYLGRSITTHSYPEIAHAMGREHHSTVHTAGQRLRRQIDADEHVRLDGGEPPVRVKDLADQLRHDITRGSRRNEESAERRSG